MEQMKEKWIAFSRSSKEHTNIIETLQRLKKKTENRTSPTDYNTKLETNHKKPVKAFNNLGVEKDNNKIHKIFRPELHTCTYQKTCKMQLQWSFKGEAVIINKQSNQFKG